MSLILNSHSSVKRLEGTETEAQGIKVVHYRGIKYASVVSRFSRAVANTDWDTFLGDKLDCTKFGPQCPQNFVDVGHLLRIPENLQEAGEDRIEDSEENCLNLNISLPSGTPTTGTLLPVLIWIHGGSQVVSYPPLAHKGGDVTPLITRSVALGKPMIVVAVNYRLNIFGFGNGKEKNLALKDQRLAIDWVVKHIEDFGGDKDNITLAGESAGAVYVDAHLSLGAPVKRAILQSGSLYLSPPLPVERGDALISKLDNWLKSNFKSSLETERSELLLRMLEYNNVQTMWIQEEPELLGWQERGTQVEELLIGDVEYESVVWRNGIETATAEEITACFESDTEYGTQLRELYAVYPDRPTSSKNGALDFITDVKFALPAEDISLRRRKDAKLKTYQYVFDETNPWQSSSRAHHAVDLIFLFGNYDLEFNPAAKKVHETMQDKWIRFISGEAPWNSEKRFAFGPFGKSGEIDDEEFGARRRERHFEVLRKIEPARLAVILGKLAAGRISLLN